MLSRIILSLTIVFSINSFGSVGSISYFDNSSSEIKTENFNSSQDFLEALSLADQLESRGEIEIISTRPSDGFVLARGGSEGFGE